MFAKHADGDISAIHPTDYGIKLTITISQVTYCDLLGKYR